MKQVTMIVLGAGGRGQVYGKYALEFPEQAKVVGVAEPRETHRQQMAIAHQIEAQNVFSDWREVVKRPRFADAVLICTQDAMHEEPAIACAACGYHILLEKPLAPTLEACQRIVEAITKYDVALAVGHVLRYTRHVRALKKLLQEKAIGELVDVQLFEPVGFWHQAHSFVRGNWRNEAETSPMLLSKSCHDIDLLRHLVDRPCRRVSSFGSLVHFRPENRPAGAADRCLDCAVEATCPYSAKRFYFERLQKEELDWPLNVVTPTPTPETLTKALREGPYGRCVYACDNDVVDHQVVNLEYEGGITATFTMSAFNEGGNRRLRMGGTRGCLEWDGAAIRLFDFVKREWQTIDPEADPTGALGGHGGGDGGLMEAFVRAVASGDRSAILSGPYESWESHKTVFAAEAARRQGSVEWLA